MSPEQGPEQSVDADQVEDLLRALVAGDVPSPEVSDGRVSLEDLPQGPDEIDAPGTEEEGPFSIGGHPLYTTKLGEAVAKGTLAVVPASVELERRFLKMVGEMVSFADQRPQKTELVDDGWVCRFLLPVVQTNLNTWPRTGDRIAHAVDSFIRSGNIKALLDVRRSLPPGRKTDLGHQVSIAREGRPFTLRGLRQAILNTLTGGKAFGVMEIVTDPIDRARKELADKQGSKKEENPLTGIPSVELRFSLYWVSPDGVTQSRDVVFPLGIMPLRIGPRGPVSEYYINIREGEESKRMYFHPALYGTRDLAGIISGVLRKRTRGLATISPASIIYAMNNARNAGERMNWALEPHFQRMEAIEGVEKVLGIDPGCVLDILPSVVRIVDIDGQVHPDYAQIYAEIAQEVLGGPEASGRNLPTTWGQLIFSIDKVCNAHGAMVLWEGNRLVVDTIIEHGGTLHEINNLYDQIIGDAAAELPRLQKPAPAATLLATSEAASCFLEKIAATLAVRDVHAKLAREAAKRQKKTAEVVVDIAKETTAAHKAYLEQLKAEYLKRLRGLEREGQRVGRGVGQGVLDSYTGKAEPPARHARPSAGEDVVSGGMEGISDSDIEKWLGGMHS